MLPVWIERSFWGFYAKSYDIVTKHFGPYQDLLHEVCDLLDELSGGRPLRVLDAGCGTGNYARALVARGHTVVGIDSSQQMLAVSKEKVASDELAEFIKTDLTQRLPFVDNEFDAVVCAMVLYTLPQPAILLQEMRRVATKNAPYCITTASPKKLTLSAFHHFDTKNGFTSRKKLLLAGFFVALCNLVIDWRVAHSSYTPLTQATFASLLKEHGYKQTELQDVYLNTGILAAGTIE